MTNQKNNRFTKVSDAAGKAVTDKTPISENRLLQGSNIVQGMVWHEILSGPLCKRRRNK